MSWYGPGELSECDWEWCTNNRHLPADRPAGDWRTSICLPHRKGLLCTQSPLPGKNSHHLQDRVWVICHWRRKYFYWLQQQWTTLVMNQQPTTAPNVVFSTCDGFLIHKKNKNKSQMAHIELFFSWIIWIETTDEYFTCFEHLAQWYDVIHLTTMNSQGNVEGMWIFNNF